MDDIVDSEELAELEALLYSQIHHSVDAEPTLPEIPISQTTSSQITPSRPRYFGVSQLPTSQPQQNEQENLPQEFPPPKVTNPTTSRLNDVQIHQEYHFKVPQYNQSGNVIIISNDNEFANNNLSKNQRRKVNRKLRMQHQEMLQKAINDAEAFKQLNKDDRGKVLKMQKRQTYLARRKERQKMQKAQELIDKFNNETVNLVEPTPAVCEGIIELSETDDDEIVAVEPTLDTVLVSSDDEADPIKAEKVTPCIVDEDDNSIQFVETPVVEPIILELELEPVQPQPLTSKTDSELMKPPSDETTSLSSAASAQSNEKNLSVTPGKSPRVVRSRVREIMNTPESSNDFLDNTLDVSDKNFNFSLHGNDMGGEKSFVKPRKLAEVLYESESSCSTSDISSVRNHVFNELEFESPAKPLFGEADLESFSAFITPKRKSGEASALSAHSTPSCAQDDLAQAKIAQKTLRSASDSSSSSESDFEECVKLPNTSAKPKKTPRKRLPSLSHFEVDEPQTKTPTKTPKNQKKAQFKFDFIIDIEEFAKDDSNTPKTAEKKNKKRKQNTTESIDAEKSETVNEDNVDPISATEKRKRRRKRLGKNKSDTEDNTKTSENVRDGSSDKSESDVDKSKDAEKPESENNDDTKASLTKKRKRSRKRSEKSKSDTEIEKNVAHKTSTKSDSEVDVYTHENTKKPKKKKGNKSDNEAHPDKSFVSESVPTEIENSSATTPQSKKKRNNKSESDCPPVESSEDGIPQETQSRFISDKNETDANLATPTSKKRKTTKSDSESTPNVTEKSANKSAKSKKQKTDKATLNASISQPENDTEKEVELTSPAKRKKRPRFESNGNEELEIHPMEDDIEDVLNTTDVSDVQIIETPIEVISLSDDDDADDQQPDDLGEEPDKVPLEESSSEEEDFNCEELDSLETNLELSNVAESSWDVLEVADSSIVYDTPTPNDVPVEGDGVPRSWLTPGFDADEIWDTLPDDQSKWKIMERDRIHIAVVERGPRCNRCREFGHIAVNCDRKQSRCWLCGEAGHQEPRCPNTMCTKCGRSTRFFTANCGRCNNLAHNRCSYCDCKGHLRYLCPDAWRRYYLTTDTKEFVTTRLKTHNILKPVKERWCSGCSKQGHLEHTCSYYNRTHTAIHPYIFKQNDIYKKINSQRKQQTEDNTLVVDVVDADRDDIEELAAKDSRDDKADVPVVAHKKVRVTIRMEPKTAQIFLNTGLPLSKLLFDDFQVSKSFRMVSDRGILNLQGFPTDLHKVRHIFKEFLLDPKSTMREVKLSNREWDALQCRCDLLNQTEVMFKVSVRSGALKKTIEIKGEVFRILLTENYLLNILRQGNQTSAINTMSQDVETYVLPKLVIDNIVSHPHMKTLAQKFSIAWNVRRNVLKLVGSKQNMHLMRCEMGDFRSSNTKPSYNLLRKINTLLTYAEFPYDGVDGLHELLKSNRIEILNVLLYAGIEEKQGGSKLRQLRMIRDIFSTHMFLSKKTKSSVNACTELIRYFKNKRSNEAYSVMINQCVGRNNTADVLNLYSFGESPDKRDTNCYVVEIKSSHMEHLQTTAEGSDFLNELNAQCPMELKKDDSMLYLYCSEAQKEKAMEKLNFYFFTLTQTFPKVGSDICALLLGRLAQAKLDYYTTTCRDLLADIKRNDGTGNFQRLNGLLFAKYELSCGRTHKEVLNYYLPLIAKKSTHIESISEYREIKTAAIHLFCSQSLAVDYDFLVSFAVPPVVPQISGDQCFETLATVNNLIKAARDKFSKPENIWKMAELKMLNAYLLNNANSKESLAVALAFLKDGFALE